MKFRQIKCFTKKSLGSKHKYFTYIKLYFDICKSKNLDKKAIGEPGEAHQMKFRLITSFANKKKFCIALMKVTIG